MRQVSLAQLKKRRSWMVTIIVGILLAISIYPAVTPTDTTPEVQDVLAEQSTTGEFATEALEQLLVKGRAPKTGYSRDEFGVGWATIGTCDTRNIMLKRSLDPVEVSDDGCVVLAGRLQDPYTGTVIQFQRGNGTSGDVQIDHVVALSDAWQKGAQALVFTDRVRLANDPLNLLAVDGPTNQEKGDSDAASWLPPNKSYRCQYVARQIAVKKKYGLWVTDAEKAAMKRVLNGCGEQRLPRET